MKKDVTILIIGMIILFLIWQSGFLTDLFAIVEPVQTTQFTSYTSEPREGSQCDIQSFWNNYDLTTSTQPIISTLLSTFQFKTTTHLSKPIYVCQSAPTQSDTIRNIQQTYTDSDGCQHWGYDIYKPYYTEYPSNIYPDYTYCI